MSFDSFLEAEIQRREGRTWILWGSFLSTLGILFTQILPRVSEISERLRYSFQWIGLGAALFVILFQPLFWQLHDSLQPPQLPSRFGLRKKLLETLSQRKPEMTLEPKYGGIGMMGFSIVGLALIDSGASIGGFKLAGEVLVGILLFIPLFATMVKDESRKLRAWSMRVRALLRGRLMWLPYACAFVGSLFLMDRVWVADTPEIAGWLVLSTAMILLSLHLSQFFLSDPTRKMLEQLRLFRALNEISEEDAKEVYVAIEIVRSEGYTEYSDLYEILSDLGKKTESSDTGVASR